MVSYMLNPIVIDGLAVLLAASLTEQLSIDEQAILGAFFNVLGDLLVLNSTYLSHFQSLKEEQDSQPHDDHQDKDENEFIQNCMDKIKEELKQIKEGE